MIHRTGAVVSVALLSVVTLATVATAVAAEPPRPGTTNSGLNESEEATLWSKQPVDNYVSPETYREAYGENRTTIHEIANGTDVSFTEPPAAADQWTTYAHETYEPGDRDASVHPPWAARTNGTYIKDAHASVFAVTPATETYLNESETLFYVAPDGQVLGVVDYRIEIPPSTTPDDRHISWELDSHEIAEVRLLKDGEELASIDGTSHPAFDYDVAGDEATFTIEADINASLVRTTRFDHSGSVHRQLLNESVTVSNSITVDIYDLRATAHHTDYPSGETGVSIFQTKPWQGYTLDENGTEEVRGVWRFYQARDTEWDTLERSTSTRTSSFDSAVLPVYVHAYPSRLGPRTKPEYGGPRIIELWGQELETPKAELPENVSVEVVDEPYEASYGMAVESRAVERDSVTVHGIVYGTKADIRAPIEGAERPLRESDLSAEIIDRNESGVTVLLSLEDAETGDPIVLDDDARAAPIADVGRDGFIEIDGERVETNATGEAVVHLREQGAYTARYDPESWLSSYPAYAGDTAVVRWHGLGTLSAWGELLGRAAIWFAPFLLVLYAGRKLGRMIHWREYP